jgi:putative lipoic acid-binding regulatory protein
VDGADHFAILDARARPEGILTRDLLAMLGRLPPGLATTTMPWRRETGGGYMAQETRFDPARLEQIERRLQVLEDAEAIRALCRVVR